MQTPNYAPRYFVRENCLYEQTQGKSSSGERLLCNFAPEIRQQIAMDDGLQITTWIRLAGVHASGRELPEIDIPASELANFNWLAQHWGMDCILEVGKTVKDCVRHAIQTTAANAERKTVFTVTGWRKLDGKWQFLMPGDEEHTVTLPRKMQGYGMDRQFSSADIRTAACLLHTAPAPEEVILPLLAFTFLSPLNHFLKTAGCEPKFVLLLSGKTGSRKSTLAALMLSFFGTFTASELPMSFQDTANSIIQNSFALKDVLTVIDDLHPSGRMEEQKMNATAQTIMRGYGDRTGKGRLRMDSSPMESRPPQGNAILTAEHPPDIGESGTARYFGLELKEKDVDLKVLSLYQQEAAKGTLSRCMYAYVQWLAERFLDTAEEEFVSFLRRQFLFYREDFQKTGIRCHGRVPETVAHLQLGMDLLLLFLQEKQVMDAEACATMQAHFRELLYGLAARQARRIEQDKPSHIFIRKLYALLESGQVHLLKREGQTFLTSGTCIGYFDENYLYLYSEVAHKLVRKFCEEQGESFPISCKALLKALAEEGLIEPGNGQNTKTIRFGSSQKRVAFLRREKAEAVREGGG